MSAKLILAVCALVAVVSAIPAQPGAGVGVGGGVNPWIPPWVAAAPWLPKFTPCTAVGSSCADCTTKQVCTKIGGLQRPCTDPTLPFCNMGECSATPSAGCQPAVVPAAAAVPA